MRELNSALITCSVIHDSPSIFFFFFSNCLCFLLMPVIKHTFVRLGVRIPYYCRSQANWCLASTRFQFRYALFDALKFTLDDFAAFRLEFVRSFVCSALLFYIDTCSSCTYTGYVCSLFLFLVFSGVCRS